MSELLAKRLNEFLEIGGAEILPITNPYELARFKTVNGVCVIYQNKKPSPSQMRTCKHCKNMLAYTCQ